MILNRRENTLLISTNSSPEWAGSYTVTVYPVGAVASAASSGSTITVDAGHSVVAGDKILVDPGGDNTFTAAVSSVTATTIVFSPQTYSVAAGDKIANLGPDTGSSTPNYDASPVKIYSDADGSTAVSNSQVTATSAGEYSYYFGGDGRAWELIRDSSGAVVDVIAGYGFVPGRLNALDYGAVGDGATDDQARIDAAMTVFDSLTQGGRVFLPYGSYLVQTPVVVHDKVVLYGENRSATVIIAGGSFSGSGVVILGETSACYGCRVEDMTVDGDTNASVGVYSQYANEQSGIRRCVVVRATSKCIHFETSTCQHWQMQDIEAYIDESAASASVVVDIDQGPGLIVGCTTNTNDDSTTIAGESTGIDVDGSGVHLIDIHCQHTANGVRIGNTTSTTGCSLHGIQGDSTITDVVELGSNAQATAVTAVLTNSATNCINDVSNSKTSTALALDCYFLGRGSAGQRPYITNDLSIDTRLTALSLGLGTAADVTLNFDLDSNQVFRWDESESAFYVSAGFQIGADPGGGTASRTTLTSATDTPTTDPGWTTSSSVNMNAPDGYMKVYVGTQAVVIPYWNT